jgi:hypothetical protein
MNRELRKLLNENTGDVLKLYQLAGVTPETIKNYILDQMATAVGEGDWEAWDTLLSMARYIESPEVKADVLNCLLVMPGHEVHQAVTMQIQILRSPSSVPYIQTVLEGGFDFLEYTASEDEVIAKWFSHALAKIGTPEAIELIKEFAISNNAGIAKEMSYRLGRLNV